MIIIKNIIEKVADTRYKNVKYSTLGNKYRKLQLHVSEVEVLKLIYEYRKKAKRCSRVLLRPK